jgi:hypothetical protein
VHTSTPPAVGSSDNHIDLSAPAFGTDQPLAPIQRARRQPLLRLFGTHRHLRVFSEVLPRRVDPLAGLVERAGELVAARHDAGIRGRFCASPVVYPVASKSAWTRSDESATATSQNAVSSPDANQTPALGTRRTVRCRAGNP